MADSKATAFPSTIVVLFPEGTDTSLYFTLSILAKGVLKRQLTTKI
jgi:hypothetical protein